jgi:hypothetical protein
MRTLTPVDTLVYYDGPQVFRAVDELGTEFICTLAVQSDSADTYLCVAGSRGRIASVMEGELDLHAFFNEPEVREYYRLDLGDGATTAFTATPIDEHALDQDWLPLPDTRLSQPLVAENEVLEQAIERGRAVLHWRMSPPEARNDSKISVEHLTQSTQLLQRLVKFAYRRALREDKHPRPDELPEENYKLQVFATSPGSFTLHLQSSLPGDMFGYVALAKALDVIDDVTSQVDDTQATVERVAAIGGHFAATYKNLLKFICDNDAPIEYQWAMPDRKSISVHAIGAREAKPLYDAISARKDIGQERVVIQGKLTKVDERSRSWRLEDDQGKSNSGFSEVVELSGLVIDRNYTFECEEHLEVEAGTGREITTLHLLSIPNR